MSIISDALKKVADNRRAGIRLREKELDRSLSGDIRRITSKRRKWNILSSVGTFFIVGFAIIAFLYNTEFLPSFVYPTKTHSIVMPKKIDLDQDTPRNVIDKETPFSIASTPEQEALLFPLILNGVIEGAGEPLAVINNKILRKGDFIHGAQVINIASDKVRLLYDNKEITLRIE